MPTETYKILNNAADYICLACGTHNCNSGVCDRCQSIQYGSPAYASSSHAQPERLMATLGPQRYAAYIADEQRRRTEATRERERAARTEARRQARDQQAEAERLAVTLPLRARWEQQRQDERAARRRSVFVSASVIAACALTAAVAVVVVRLADLNDTASYSAVTVVLAAIGGGVRSWRRRPDPLGPKVTGSSYSRAPRSE